MLSVATSVISSSYLLIIQFIDIFIEYELSMIGRRCKDSLLWALLLIMQARKTTSPCKIFQNISMQNKVSEPKQRFYHPVESTSLHHQNKRMFSAVLECSSCPI